jgi:hypothetical protein
MLFPAQLKLTGRLSRRGQPLLDLLGHGTYYNMPGGCQLEISDTRAWRRARYRDLAISSSATHLAALAG